jgi:hypothetical protein
MDWHTVTIEVFIVIIVFFFFFSQIINQPTTREVFFFGPFSHAARIAAILQSERHAAPRSRGRSSGRDPWRLPGTAACGVPAALPLAVKLVHLALVQAARKGVKTALLSLGAIEPNLMRALTNTAATREPLAPGAVTLIVLAFVDTARANHS